MGKKSAAIVKRDTKENWRKSKYIPEVGIIVIMDCADGSVELMFGDGETPVNELPNLLNDSRGTAKIVDGNILVL